MAQQQQPTGGATRHRPTIQAPLYARVASASVGAVLTSLMMTPLDVVKTRLQLPAQHQPRASQHHPVPANATASSSSSRCSQHTQHASTRSPFAPATTQTYHAYRGAGSRLAAASYGCACPTPAPPAHPATKLPSTNLLASHATSTRLALRPVGAVLPSLRGALQHSAGCLASTSARQCHCSTLAAFMPGHWAGAATASSTASSAASAAASSRWASFRAAQVALSWLSRKKPAATAAAASTATVASVAAKQQKPHHRQPPLRMGTWAMAGHLVRTEGPRGLYAGLTPTLAMAVPATTLYYSSYDWLRDAYVSHCPAAATAAAPVVAGTSARAVAVAIISPLELIRTKMQATEAADRSRSIAGAVRAEVKAHGVRSLWRGLVPTLWRDVPFSGIYWLTYERTKARLEDLQLARSQAPTFGSQFRISFLSGAAAGSVAALVTQPFDVVKTQVQAQLHAASAQQATTRAAPVAPPMMSVMRGIIASEGGAAVFAGLLPRLAKVAPACAIMISSYECGKMLFGSTE